MVQISVIDQPVISKKEDGVVRRRNDLGNDNPDKLGTGQYAETLAKFIRECDTPLTIGVQGEWGSGKTSLLNMIREDIQEEERSHRSKTIKGSDEFLCIWINTWEHSLLKSPEQCLLSIIEEIIDEIAAVDNTYNTTEKAKSALSILAKGAVRVGATMALGAEGRNVANDLMGGSTPSNTVKQLRQSLENIVKTVVDREQNSATKFVIFIDDLDRLEPSVAVMVLELLKNIFTIRHCVFVLAIDYQVVVKGLKGKFGDPTTDNEWEFRAFFDKIIQLPFMMPMAQYDLKNYINTLLIDEINYFQKSEKASIEDGRLAKAVKLTLGHNPRAMKRLLNSLSLLKLQFEDRLKEFRLRQLVFALVCCQISYPRIYELLLREPDFSSWDTEFVNKITGGPHEENLEIGKALDRAMQVHEGDFDEEWEQCLFKIVWLKEWQRNRLPEISRLLSEIKDKILSESDAAEFKNQMEDCLKMTAVTAVSSTDEGVFSGANDSDEEGQEASNRIDYWTRFARTMKGSETVFDSNITAIKSTHSSGTLTRKLEEVSSGDVAFIASTSGASPLKFETVSGDPIENHKLFVFLRKNKSSLESISEGKISFKISPNASKQSMIFESPIKLPKKKCKLENSLYKEDAQKVHDWMAEALKKLEPILSHLINEEFDASAIEAELKQEQSPVVDLVQTSSAGE
jgi:hypothetical protein